MKIAHRKKASSFSELDPTSVPWHKDPILKYAWRIPLVVLVPFFLFLSRHKLAYLLSNSLPIIVLLLAGISAIVVAAIVIKGTKRDELVVVGGFSLLAALVLLPMVVIGFAISGINTGGQSSEFQASNASSTTTDRRRAGTK